MKYSKFDRLLQIITIISLIISTWSLILSQRAFDIANTELENVKFQLGAFENKIIFLKTEHCEIIWFNNNPKEASCYNGTTWDTCIEEFQGSNGCKNKGWFNEVKQTYSWNKTNGTW